MADNGKPNSLQASMAKAKAGRTCVDVALGCVELCGARRLRRGRAAGEVGARREDPRHLRGHAADPAADRRPPAARQELGRTAVGEVSVSRLYGGNRTSSGGGRLGVGDEGERGLAQALGQDDHRAQFLQRAAVALDLDVPLPAASPATSAASTSAGSPASGQVGVLRLAARGGDPAVLDPQPVVLAAAAQADRQPRVRRRLGDRCGSRWGARSAPGRRRRRPARSAGPSGPARASAAPAPSRPRSARRRCRSPAGRARGGARCRGSRGRAGAW